MLCSDDDFLALKKRRVSSLVVGLDSTLNSTRFYCANAQCIRLQSNGSPAKTPPLSLCPAETHRLTFVVSSVSSLLELLFIVFGESCSGVSKNRDASDTNSKSQSSNSNESRRFELNHDLFDTLNSTPTRGRNPSPKPKRPFTRRTMRSINHSV
jgi:hypothetical protein